MPACPALKGFGEPRSLGLLERGLGYRSRNALGLGKGQAGGRSPETANPDMQWDSNGTAQWEEPREYRSRHAPGLRCLVRPGRSSP